MGHFDPVIRAQAEIHPRPAGGRIGHAARPPAGRASQYDARISK